MSNAPRSRSFGAVASDYDRFRPGYADDLILRVIGACGDGNIVEIGSGTGIATRQLLAAGAVVQCIEPDAAMAALMTAHELRPSSPSWIGTYEEWARTVPPGSVSGLVSAEAWHWVEQPIGWDLAAVILADGAPVAFLSNHAVMDFPWPEASMSLLLREHSLEGEPPHVVAPEAAVSSPSPDLWFSCRDSEFEPPFVTSTRWTRRQSAAEFVAQFSTASAVLALPRSTREALSAALLRLVHKYAGETVETTMISKLEITRRRPRDS